MECLCQQIINMFPGLGKGKWRMLEGEGGYLKFG